MEQSLTAVLQAGAEELVELSVVADQLGSVGLGDLERWQALDRLSQHLGGMAAFLTSLADALPDARLDLTAAFSRLTTEALASRLAGRAVSGEVESGALEMFDS